MGCVGLTLLIREDSSVWDWVPPVTRQELLSIASGIHIPKSHLLTILVWRNSLLRHFDFTGFSYGDSLSLTRPKLPLVHDRIEAPCHRNIVPKASHVGLFLRTLG
jgi:hypothetical protein